MLVTCGTNILGPVHCKSALVSRGHRSGAPNTYAATVPQKVYLLNWLQVREGWFGWILTRLV